MDQRLAPWFFLGGILLMMLGIYGAQLNGPKIETEFMFTLFSKEAGLQLSGMVFSILGFFGVIRGFDQGEEF